MRDYEELVKALRETRETVRENPSLAMRVPPYQLSAAADAIEELQEDNNALNGTVANLIQQIPEISKSKWVSVKERLPLYGQDVLAVRTYGDGEKCQEVLMAHIAVWNEETGKKWWNATNITHWMPLPEPPKEET